MRFATVVARLASVNSVVVLAALVTSPILARALGPSGRGDVAAILVVLGLAPLLCDLGLYVYISRERARGVRRLGDVLGSTLPIVLAGALTGVFLAVPIAHAIGRGRDDVTLFIALGLLLLPLTAFFQVLYGVLTGAQRWQPVIIAKLLTAGGSTLLIVALSIVGGVTVSSVAIVLIVSSVVGNVPLLVALRGSRPWRFRSKIAREGLAFGARSWVWSLAGTSVVKLDQLLMAVIVSSRELGLYALAVTLATASAPLTGAVVTALLPRVAAGDPTLAARSCRVAIFVALVYGIALGIVSPFLIPLVFTSGFTGAVPMLLILLLAHVFFVPTQVLGTALIAAGSPGAAARSQIVGLGVTVVGLVIALPLAGGVGAAIVSVLAYAATSAVVFVAAVRAFGVPPARFLIVNASDIRWCKDRLRGSRSRNDDSA